MQNPTATTNAANNSLVMKLWLTMLRTNGAHQLLTIDNAASVMHDHNTIKDGLTFDETTDAPHYIKRHTIENGIERIVYTPKARKYETPILMTHGMWHGAWCWEGWMALFAEWGWECHAYSLPGHGLSPVQRPIPECTLDYYTSFLRNEVDRLERLPVLMGHSMGGAISQWYLRYVRDDVPAVVLVASWVSHAAFPDGAVQFFKIDPIGVLRAFRVGNATPYVRSPQVAARKLISDGAVITPEELHARLGPESALVTLQHNPPMWEPKAQVSAPMLYLAGEIDTVISNRASRRTADHYGADFELIKRAAHNLMMEHNYQETARYVHTWLADHH